MIEMMRKDMNSCKFLSYLKYHPLFTTKYLVCGNSRKSSNQKAKVLSSLVEAPKQISHPKFDFNFAIMSKTHMSTTGLVVYPTGEDPAALAR